MYCLEYGNGIKKLSFSFGRDGKLIEGNINDPELETAVQGLLDDMFRDDTPGWSMTDMLDTMDAAREDGDMFYMALKATADK